MSIFQFDLTSDDAQTIIDSVTLVYDEYDHWGEPPVLGFQLAPNGKIYIARFNSDYLSEISSPNEPGLGCQVADSSVFLGPNGLCTYSLPSFIPDFDYDNELVICNTEIEEHISIQNIVLYPNPTEGVVAITSSADMDMATINIYNIVGKRVYTTTLNLSTQDSRNFDLGFLPGGSYIVEIIGSGTRFYEKLWKVNR